MQKRHLNRSVYLEGTSNPQSQISASGCEPTPVHFPYLQKANVMLHFYSEHLQKRNVEPYFHFSYIQRGNIVPHSHFHPLHRANVVSHWRFAGLKFLGKGGFLYSRSKKTARMRRICCFLGIVLLALGVHAKNNGTEKRLPIVTEICVANIDQTIDHSNNYGGWIDH